MAWLGTKVGLGGRVVVLVVELPPPEPLLLLPPFVPPLLFPLPLPPFPPWEDAASTKLASRLIGKKISAELNFNVEHREPPLTVILRLMGVLRPEIVLD